MGFLGQMNSTGWMILLGTFALVAAFNCIAYYAEYWIMNVEDGGDVGLVRIYLHKGICWQAEGFEYDCFDWDDLVDWYNDLEDYGLDDDSWSGGIDAVESYWEPAGILVIVGLALSCLIVVLCLVALFVKTSQGPIQMIVPGAGILCGITMLCAMGMTVETDLTKEGNSILLPQFEIEESDASWGFSILTVGWLIAFFGSFFALFPCNVDPQSGLEKVATNVNL